MTVSGQEVIIGVHHDLARKQSMVRLVWDGEPEKALAVPVPFGCGLADLPDVAEKRCAHFRANLPPFPSARREAAIMRSLLIATGMLIMQASFAPTCACSARQHAANGYGSQAAFRCAADDRRHQAEAVEVLIERRKANDRAANDKPDAQLLAPRTIIMTR